MKPVCVIDCDALRQMQRREMFAYIGSFIAQGIAFGLGWIACANWALIERIWK
jgi:hypothetical protein